MFAPLLFLIFCVLRLLPLLSGVESVSDLEELSRGTIAREILSGLNTGFWNYQADVYSGGSLVTGMLAAFSFKLLGPNLFALKCVPLFFSFAVLASVFIFLRRFFGNRPAVLGLALFVFAPPNFVRFSLLAMGFHSEVLLGAVWILYWTYRVLEDRAPKRAHFMVLGFIAGISCWFSYIAGLVWLSSVSILFYRGVLRKDRRLPVLLAGFLIGLAPWIFYNFSHDFSGLKFIVRSFIPPEARVPDIFKLTRILTEGFAASFGFKSFGIVPGVALNWIYWAMALGVTAAGVFRKKSGAGLTPLLAPCLGFVIFYWASGFSPAPSGGFLEFRYYVFLIFFLLLLLSVACAALPWGRYAAAIFMLLGLAGQTSLWGGEPWARALEYRGYSYYQTGWSLHALSESAQKKFLEKAGRKLPAKDYRSVLWSLAYGVRNPDSFSSLWPMEMRWALAEAIGNQDADWTRLDSLTFPPEITGNDLMRSRYFEGLASRLFITDWERVPAFLDFLEKVPGAEKRFFYWSLGRFVVNQGRETPAETGKLMARLEASPEALLNFYEGMGQEAASEWVYERRDFGEILKALPPINEALRPNFAWGLGWGVRREINEDSKRAADWLKNLPEDFQSDALKGFYDCENRYRIRA